MHDNNPAKALVDTVKELHAEYNRIKKPPNPWCCGLFGSTTEPNASQDLLLQNLLHREEGSLNEDLVVSALLALHQKIVGYEATYGIGIVWGQSAYRKQLLKDCDEHIRAWQQNGIIDYTSDGKTLFIRQETHSRIVAAVVALHNASVNGVPTSVQTAVSSFPSPKEISANAPALRLLNVVRDPDQSLSSQSEVGEEEREEEQQQVETQSLLAEKLEEVLTYLQDPSAIKNPGMSPQEYTTAEQASSEYGTSLIQDISRLTYRQQRTNSNILTQLLEQEISIWRQLEKCADKLLKRDCTRNRKGNVRSESGTYLKAKTSLPHEFTDPKKGEKYPFWFAFNPLGKHYSNLLTVSRLDYIMPELQTLRTQCQTIRKRMLDKLCKQAIEIIAELAKNYNTAQIKQWQENSLPSRSRYRGFNIYRLEVALLIANTYEFTDEEDDNYTYEHMRHRILNELGKNRELASAIIDLSNTRIREQIKRQASIEDGQPRLRRSDSMTSVGSSDSDCSEGFASDYDTPSPPTMLGTSPT